MVQLQSNQLGLLLLHDMSCRACRTLGQSNKDCKETSRIRFVSHGLRTPNEGVNQRNLKIDVVFLQSLEGCVLVSHISAKSGDGELWARTDKVDFFGACHFGKSLNLED